MGERMTGGGFDRVAGQYQRLERLVFGERLQRCRTAWLPQLSCDAMARRARVLVLGEGDGRFVAALRRACPEAVVLVVDRSERMCRLAAERVAAVAAGAATDAAANAAAAARVQWVLGDLVAGLPVGAGGFDLVVCNFVLDCFAEEELDLALPRIVAALAPGGTLVVGDFATSARGAWRLRLVAGIGARRLTDPQPRLAALGLRERGRREWLGGFLVSTLWCRADECAAVLESRRAEN